ncbi:AraC family transcriptional regulator, partial [Flavobacterium circumlabens]
MVVKSQFEKLGLHTIAVELGEVELQEELTENQKRDLLQSLHSLGFDLLDDKKSKTIEKIKTLIIDLVHHKNNELKINLSDYLSENLHQDYN